MKVASPLCHTFREPKSNLLLSIFHGVTSMDDIPTQDVTNLALNQIFRDPGTTYHFKQIICFRL